MKEFAPDGGWDEGPGYWNYATIYNVYYLAAIESALGTDFGLEKMPGFSDAGSFHIQLTGPGKKLFNFADAGEGYETAPQMFWLAKHFNRPTYAAWERANSAGKMSIFHLLWFNPDGNLDAADDLPLDTVFKRVNVGVFRSSFFRSQGVVRRLQRRRQCGQPLASGSGVVCARCPGAAVGDGSRAG